MQFSFVFSTLERGDHITVPGKLKAVLKYFHHGIYLGTDMAVAEFSTDKLSKTSAHIRKTDIWKFKGDNHLYKFIYPEGTCNRPEAAASLAEEVVNAPDIWGRYHFLTNNCEHFATKCKTGQSFSIQVEHARKVFKKKKEAAARSARLACYLL